jgi:GNAT superfamily N-acetyltransferase
MKPKTSKKRIRARSASEGRFAINYVSATVADAGTLAELNQQLIRDERHRNRMSLPQLKKRMANWLLGEYEAILFDRQGETLGYVLFRRDPEHVYLRQFFVRKEFRRQGIGRGAIEWLCRKTWQNARLRLDVLVMNKTGITFWRSVGFHDYCITMEKENQCAGG